MVLMNTHTLYEQEIWIELMRDAQPMSWADERSYEFCLSGGIQ